MEEHPVELENVTMNDILKKVYAVHRIALRENTNRNITENNRDGSCCEAIRQSLQLMTSSYKEVLEQKDSRIRQLEEYLRKYKRRLSNMDSMDVTFSSSYDERSLPKRQSIASVPEQSPDSTSRATPRVSLDKSFDDLVFDGDHDEKGVEHTQEGTGPKLKLQRKRNKRSRYTEDISPEMKRPRQVSPMSAGAGVSSLGRGMSSATGGDPSGGGTVSSTNKTQTEQTRTLRIEKKQESRPNTDHTLPNQSKQNKKSHRVFVPETCYPPLDDTLTSHGLEIEDEHHTNMNADVEINKVNHKKHSLIKRNLARKKEFDETVLVVPETLAMDTDSLYDDDDDDEEVEKPDSAKAGRYNPELSKIAEESASLEKSKDITNYDHNHDDDLIGACDKDFKKEKPTELRNDKTAMSVNTCKPATSNSTEFSLRSMLLDSPGSDKSCSDGENIINTPINHRTLQLGGTSYVHNSDHDLDDLDDLENAAAPCSQKFKISKSKNSNTCESLVQVDELFETPAAKGSNTSDESRMKNLRNANDKEMGVQSKNKKPLFKKKQIQFEEENDIVLRRSPRKHKGVKPENERLSVKVKTKSAVVRMKDKETCKADINIENDSDLTIQPEQIEEGKPANMNTTENQSLDYCNVFPVTDGVPVAYKKFQLKMPRNRMKNSSTKLYNDEKNQKFSDENSDLIVDVKLQDNFNETMTSPSILHGRERSSVRGQSSQSEVITIGSPSVGSMSDPESPLLLKIDRKNVGPTSIETNAVNVCDMEWKSKSEMKRTASSAQNASLTTAKSTRSNSVHQRSSQGQDSGSDKTNTSRVVQNTGSKNKVYFTSDSTSVAKSKSPKSLHQMTLTQGFFSPSKKRRQKSVANDEKDLQEAIRQSLEESRSSQHLVPLDNHDVECLDDIAIVNKQNSPFKKPSGPVKKERRSSRGDKKKTKEMVVELIDLDDTVAPNLEDSHVLREVKDQSSNITVGCQQGQRLNGSLDPAAELSQWCREPGTLASDDEEIDLMKSLPSLDVNDFRIEDLHTGSQSLPKTSTLAVDDSQDIPSSYKFGPRKKIAQKAPCDDMEDQENVRPATSAVNDSFDRPPKKLESDIAHVTVVRKRDERQKLQGHGCKQCLEYYKSAGKDEKEIKQHMQQCSRHRAQYLPPDTPPHFWSVGFIDTQECVDRGYLKIENTDDKDADVPTYRRRRKLNKIFKSKSEGASQDDDSQEDLEF